MSYVFLIMVTASTSLSMQVEPMDSMQQCQAAIKAIHMVEDQRSWTESQPRVGSVKCVEVQR